MKLIRPLAFAALAVALPEFQISRSNNAHVNSNARRALRARDPTGTSLIDAPEFATGSAYYINVTAGTPPQPQVVLIDTGSSDFFLVNSNEKACAASPNPCIGGTFNPNSSSTYKQLYSGAAFNVSYGDGSASYGPLGSDFVEFSNVRVSNVPFGVTTYTNNTTGPPIGTMGLSFAGQESVGEGVPPYANMPQVMMESGVTQTMLFSVYLNPDESAVTGSLLFGGIDTSKYTGTMSVQNMLATAGDNGAIERYLTTITGLQINAYGQSQDLLPSSSNTQEPAQNELVSLVDSGTSSLVLPQKLAEAVQKPFSWIDSNGNAACSHRNDNAGLVIELAHSINITVPIRSLLTPLYDSNLKPQPYGSGGTACTWNVNGVSRQATAGQGYVATLGDAAMRNMYVVFDQTNAQMGFAQAAQMSNDTKSNIIPVGASGIANALQSKNQAVIPASARQTAIPPSPANSTVSMVATTVQQAIGTATGVDALPFVARPSTGAAAAAPHKDCHSAMATGLTAGLVCLVLGF